MSEHDTALSIPAGMMMVSWQDRWQEAIKRLSDRVFGPENRRQGRAAVGLRRNAERLEEHSFQVYQLSDEVLIGSVECYPIDFVPTDSPTDIPRNTLRKWSLMGPLVVHPHQRGKGIGGALVRAACSSLLRGGYTIVCIGDPGYYVPLGFCPQRAAGLTVCGEVAPLMVLVFRSEQKAMNGQLVAASTHNPGAVKAVCWPG